MHRVPINAHSINCYMKVYLKVQRRGHKFRRGRRRARKTFKFTKRSNTAPFFPQCPNGELARRDASHDSQRCCSASRSFRCTSAPHQLSRSPLVRASGVRGLRCRRRRRHSAAGTPSRASVCRRCLSHGGTGRVDSRPNAAFAGNTPPRPVPRSAT